MRSNNMLQIIVMLLLFIFIPTGCEKSKIKEINMDTHRSEKIVKTYLEQKGRPKRKELEFSGTIKAKAKEIFPLLCPVREGDWVKNWTCDMIYSESGVAEEKCVFRTTDANPHHTGLWTFTEYEKNRRIAFVRLEKNIISHTRIDLSENGDGTTTGTWDVSVTALNEKGNRKVGKMKGGTRPTGPVVPMIEHYLEIGKRISILTLLKNAIHG